MTKAEFVDKLAEKGKITKKHASETIDLVFSTMSDVLVAGEEIAIPGFGKFSVATRKARTGMNPRPRRKSRSRKQKSQSFHQPRP